MKTLLWLGCGFVLVLLISCELLTNSAKPPVASQQDDAIAAEPSVLEVPGRTQYVPGRKGIIARVPLHPVVAVLVAPGDLVKKGQALVKLDDDEAQADVRAKQAGLENSRVAVQERRRYLGVLEKAHQNGSVPEEKYHDARVATVKAEIEERIARAALESARAELEHFVVTAPLAGIVSWLDVHPGMVSRPGTTVWGEILDLRAIDVHCEVTPGQADRLAVGQPAEVLLDGEQEVAAGRLAFVGITADKATGLVPIVNSYGSASAYGSSSYVPDSARYFASGVSGDYSPSTSPAASPAPAVADTAVVLSVRVPANAEIWFNGAKTHLTGAFREFVSPPLTPGHDGTYDLRARWEEDGHQVERTRQVTVRAGDRLSINFLTPS